MRTCPVPTLPPQEPPRTDEEQRAWDDARLCALRGEERARVLGQEATQPRCVCVCGWRWGGRGWESVREGVRVCEGVRVGARQGGGEHAGSAPKKARPSLYALSTRTRRTAANEEGRFQSVAEAAESSPYKPQPGMPVAEPGEQSKVRAENCCG